MRRLDLAGSSKRDGSTGNVPLALKAIVFCVAHGLMYASAEAQEVASQTVIHGVARAAVSRVALSEVTVTAGPVATRSDSTGKFSLIVPRTASSIAFSRTGYQQFEFPLLVLQTDTLHADIEMRSDPPAPTVTPNGSRVMPFLCIVLDSPDRLLVKNACTELPRPLDSFQRRVYQMTPNAISFGDVARIGGVMVLTRR